MRLRIRSVKMDVIWKNSNFDTVTYSVLRPFFQRFTNFYFVLFSKKKKLLFCKMINFRIFLKIFSD